MKTAVIIALLCGFLVLASMMEESEAAFSLDQHGHYRSRRRRWRRRHHRRRRYDETDDVDIEGTCILCNLSDLLLSL